MGVSAIPNQQMQGVLVAAMGAKGCRALFEDARVVSFDAGQTIFSAGDPGSHLILIEMGRVEISNTSFGGRKSVLAQMGPGEVLGEIAALDGGARSADAVAATKVQGLILTRDNVLAHVTADPAIARAVIIELCHKVRNASEMFLTQSLTEGGPRLARALMKLFDQWGEIGSDGALRLAERFSQQEIGELSGLARENVNRQIKTWVEAEVLGQDGRHLILRDRDTLETLAEA